MTDAGEVPFARRVIAAVHRVPFGRVASYGDIAAMVGAPRAARGVGRALQDLPPHEDAPWWRIVNSRGEISIRHMGGRLQRMLLEQEGVRFGPDGRIDLRRFRWRPDGESIDG